jgi:uncharacterized cupin superfamily protein
VNVYSEDWQGGSDRPGYAWRSMRIAGELLAASVYELQPGQKSFPYHAHHANEEFLVVLDGEVILRDPAGEHALTRGDARVFERGLEGGHQLRNDADVPARVLMASTRNAPDVVDYPDSGKAGFQGPTLERGIFKRESAVDYWTGE